jgi:hypothetical protein
LQGRLKHLYAGQYMCPLLSWHTWVSTTRRHGTHLLTCVCMKRRQGTDLLACVCMTRRQRTHIFGLRVYQTTPGDTSIGLRVYDRCQGTYFWLRVGCHDARGQIYWPGFVCAISDMGVWLAADDLRSRYEHPGQHIYRAPQWFARRRPRAVLHRHVRGRRPAGSRERAVVWGPWELVSARGHGSCRKHPILWAHSWGNDCPKEHGAFPASVPCQCVNTSHPSCCYSSRSHMLCRCECGGRGLNAAGKRELCLFGPATSHSQGLSGSRSLLKTKHMCLSVRVCPRAFYHPTRTGPDPTRVWIVLSHTDGRVIDSLSLHDSHTDARLSLNCRCHRCRPMHIAWLTHLPPE